MTRIKTLNELIEALEDMREEYGPDAMIMMAHQPGYPLRSRIGDPVEFDGVIYLPEAGSQDYCPRQVFEGI